MLLYNPKFKSQHIFSILLFLTILIIPLVTAHKIVHKHLDLMFLTFIVMFMGIYFAHVNPKYFVLFSFNNNTDNFILHDTLAITLNDILHIVPFFFVYAIYGKYYSRNFKYLLLLRTICLLTIYFIVFQPSKIYFVQNKELFKVFFIATMIYILIIYKLS